MSGSTTLPAGGEVFGDLSPSTVTPPGGVPMPMPTLAQTALDASAAASAAAVTASNAIPLAKIGEAGTGVAPLLASGGVATSKLGLLRKLAQNAAISNPRTSGAPSQLPVITQARNYASNATFAAGDVCSPPYGIGSGNFYKATVGGVTGASSQPSGTGTGIVDGGVTWEYFGTSPTQKTLSSTQPTPIQLLGGTVNAGQGTVSCTTINGAFQQAQLTERFFTDSQYFVIDNIFDAPPTALKIRVNGQYIPIAADYTLEGYSFFIFDFSNAGGQQPREISISGCNTTYGLWISPTETVWPAETPSIRCFLVGDSDSAGGSVGLAGNPSTVLALIALPVDMVRDRWHRGSRRRV